MNRSTKRLSALALVLTAAACGCSDAGFNDTPPSAPPAGSEQPAPPTPDAAPPTPAPTPTTDAAPPDTQPKPTEAGAEPSPADSAPPLDGGPPQADSGPDAPKSPDAPPEAHDGGGVDCAEAGSDAADSTAPDAADAGPDAADAGPDAADAGPDAADATGPDSADTGGPPVCEPGWADCDGLAANGCETNTQSSAESCGGCGLGCPSAAHSSSVCSDGNCLLQCALGFSDCDGSPSNGCEADVLGSTQSCGGCGSACQAAPHASPVCAQGACALACDVGFGNCDGSPANGCETDTLGSVAHCGGCAKACPTPANAAASCSAGACFFQCTAGHADCDGAPANGCEIDISTDLSNCGGCGKACGTAHGTPSCSGGACAIQCAANHADCNGANADGCEAALESDPKNCGACGHDCRGGACAGFLCVPNVISSVAQGPRGIALFGDRVFWTSVELGKVLSAPKAGGGQLTHATVSTPRGIAADGTGVYFAQGALDGTVSWADLSGWSTQAISSFVQYPEGVAIDTSDVYFSAGPHLWRVPKIGGSMKALLELESVARPVAVDGTHVYFAEDKADGRVGRVPKGGGAWQLLASGQQRPGAVALDADNVYWVNSSVSAPAVLAMPKAGGAQTALGSGHVRPAGIALDATHVYWTDKGAGTVRKVPVGGGAPVYVAMGQAGAWQIAVDSAFVYWLNDGTGQVMRVAK